MSDPLTPEQQIIEVLKDVSRDNAYQLLAGLMHTLLDLMADRQVDMLLIFFVTHAWESRAARAAGRTPNFATKHQLTQYADLKGNQTGSHIKVSVTPRITLRRHEWDHLA
jgi:hypothetical protein